MTFDKKFYEFSGECSYVLARDFIDGNFSVVANYDSVGGSKTKKSLTVMVDNKPIEIFPNFKVLVDGRRSEMPVQFGSTVVRRLGNFIRVDSNRGVTVTCNLPYNRCTVNVTGWYYAKTGGSYRLCSVFSTPSHQKIRRKENESCRIFCVCEQEKETCVTKSNCN